VKTPDLLKKRLICREITWILSAFDLIDEKISGAAWQKSIRI
jgi:hypothetical protein